MSKTDELLIEQLLKKIPGGPKKAEEASAAFQQLEQQNPQKIIDREKERKAFAVKAPSDSELARERQRMEGVSGAKEQLRQGKIRDQFKEIVEHPDQYRHLAYLTNVYREGGRTDTALQDLLNLIEKDPRIAEIVRTLATGGEGLHSRSRDLLEQGIYLLYEASQSNIPGASEAVKPLLDAIEEQAKRLFYQEKEFEKESLKETYERAGRRLTDAQFWIDTLEIPEEDTKQREEIAELFERKNPKEVKEKLQEKILKKFIKEPMEEPMFTPSDAPPPWYEEAMARTGEEATAAAENFKQELENYWREEVELREGKQVPGQPTRAPLTIKDFKNLADKIQEMESEALPKEVLSGTKAFQDAAEAINTLTKDKLKVLTKRTQELLEAEGPPAYVGKMTKEEFLRFIASPGSFSHVNFERDAPEIRELLCAHTEEGHKFREQVFLLIHSGVLTQRHKDSRDTFGLYQQSDFDGFLNTIRTGMANRIDPRNRRSVGLQLVEHFSILSDTIRLSRDIDHNASQPGQNMEGFARILALYQNEYAVKALSIPAVEQAFRAYETTLRGIMGANDGYIPPALVEYDPQGGGGEWDIRTEQMLTKWAEQGVLFDIKRDPNNHFLPVVDPGGNTFALDLTPGKMKEKLDEDKGGLELAMYTTLAKGLGMTNLRFLDYFAHSKVPSLGIISPHHFKGFHSIAGYEGTAAGLNYARLVFEKFTIGDVKFQFIFNQLAAPGDKPFSLNSREAIEAYRAYRDGTFVDKYGPEAKRLLDMFNFSGISSALGANYTGWRFFDASIGWTDYDKELLGGPARIMLSRDYAERKVQEYFVELPFKRRYQEHIIELNQRLSKRGVADKDLLPEFGPRFEAMWQKEGRPQYLVEINRLIEEFQGKTKQGKVLHTVDRHHYDEMKKLYQKAFNARVWVEMAMRNPIAVAHNVDVSVPIAGFDKEYARIHQRGEKRTKKMKLHQLIVQEVLGITPEDLEYATVLEEQPDGTFVLKQSAGKFTSPNQEQRKYIAELLDLEGDLACVREVAIREHRDLTEEDFDVIRGVNADTRRIRAKKYWAMVRQAMLGSTDMKRARQLYERFGLTFPKEKDALIGDYLVDWHTVENIDTILNDLKSQTGVMEFETPGGPARISMILDENFVKKDWDWMFGTDDVALRQLDIKNLGSRHWFRRGGADVIAHVNGGNKMIEYVNALSSHPDMDALDKILNEMVLAYSGDDINKGWDVAGLLSIATDKLYAYDIKRLGSSAQLEVWGSRFGVESWMPNERWKWWHGKEAHNVLPPHGHDFWMAPHQFNVHDIMWKKGHVMRDLIIQMLLMGSLAAVLLTVYRGVTAKSEEEEDH